MTIVDQTITDKVKFEEYQKKHRELMKQRKTEGKKYKLRADYHIRMKKLSEATGLPVITAQQKPGQEDDRKN